MVISKNRIKHILKHKHKKQSKKKYKKKKKKKKNSFKKKKKNFKKKKIFLKKKNGKFILEIGFNQKNKVNEILKEEGFYINKAVRDYGNNERCIISTKI